MLIPLLCYYYSIQETECTDDSTLGPSSSFRQTLQPIPSQDHRDHHVMPDNKEGGIKPRDQSNPPLTNAKEWSGHRGYDVEHDATVANVMKIILPEEAMGGGVEIVSMVTMREERNQSNATSWKDAERKRLSLSSLGQQQQQDSACLSSPSARSPFVVSDLHSDVANDSIGEKNHFLGVAYPHPTYVSGHRRRLEKKLVARVPKASSSSNVGLGFDPRNKMEESADVCVAIDYPYDETTMDSML